MKNDVAEAILKLLADEAVVTNVESLTYMYMLHDEVSYVVLCRM